ncbi:FACT complex subunit SPT16 [Coniophora puteana RWD-64-598 SS2]|uniref:FACT complex subunit n=1 Tax=Coniophora puteana (strain RWD-64-598) TaxID=741705 RepID=A0A5M3N3F5_CONPW|nr:FACT complex subunit SPT16 [Coniophora puteana RWD-64-598 SS2]EIW85375.1 FACT complex subunit SPT16 [Coniophora puteana RWD-64-598 SS2]
MQVELNKAQFSSRLQTIYDGWNGSGHAEEYGPISDVEGLLLLSGDPAGEDEPIRKGTAFQTWLLGYEFPSTFILFLKSRVLMLCSANKAKHLQQVKDAHPNVGVEILSMAKGKEPPSDALPKFVEAYSACKRVACLTKETYSGKVYAEWEKALGGLDTKPEIVDLAPAMSTFMAVKDDDEIKLTRTAAALTSTLLTHHIAVKLEMILDKEAKITHEQFAAQIEGRLGSGEGDNAKGPDMKVWSKGRGLNDVDWGSTEFCYSPIIQSRSTNTGYDLRSTHESTDDAIAHKGVFLIAVGMRYKSYCANVGRSIIVDPSKASPEQEEIYNLLLSLQGEVLREMKNGVKAREVYQTAIDFVRSKKPELEKNFVKNIGSGTGIEFRDSAYLLSLKNSRPLRTNMIFNLTLGFSDLVDEGGKKYALHLVDTVRVNADKASLMTEGVRSTKDTLFFLNPENEDEYEEELSSKAKGKAPAKSHANGSPVKNKTAGGKVLRNKTRSAAQEEVLHTAAARIKEHQGELHSTLQNEGLAKYAEGGSAGAGKEGKGWKRFQSYKGEGALPKDVESLRIVVDRKAQTIILPVHGFAVPFHINTIKNVSKNDEGEFTYLRINFQTPGQLAGKKEDTPFEDPDATFIRSVTYRSTDGHRFDHISKQITELKKEVNKREQQKKEFADVIEQDTLVEIKGRRPQKLPEVFVRPALDGKRLPGEVEIHQNGLRYQSPMGSQKIDVLFSNIKHLFFQPCDKELLVIVHVHLKAPILVGKRKAHDIQFFREASDVQFDETGNRKRKHRYGDEDEIEMEQQERKRRQMLNKEFKLFAERVAEAASTSTGDTLEVDIPFRELAFEGVPFRTNVRLQPTTECLVHLVEPPFLVVTLSDIEITSLERVQFSLKQFDMVLIFKDFTKPPLHINSIPSSQLDDVKNWLDSVDIAFSEGPVNLNWGPIMKTINESPYDFFQQGGWTFLGGGGAESDNESDSGSESEFEADSEELVSEESEAAESEYSDFSDASDDSGGGSFDDGDSDGDDWDELERKAAKCKLISYSNNPVLMFPADAKHAEVKGGRGSDSEDERPKKKKGAAASGSKGRANGKPAANGKSKR